MQVFLDFLKKENFLFIKAKEAVADKQQNKQEKNSEDLQDVFTVPNPLSPGGGTTSLLSSGAQRKLKIYRTIKNTDGTESVF